MPNDDESKKDDQGSGGSARKQDEQKPPVYLFPENSVYDLAPIVVPENMRLAPDSDGESTGETDVIEPGAVEIKPQSETAQGETASVSETNEAKVAPTAKLDEANGQSDSAPQTGTHMPEHADSVTVSEYTQVTQSQETKQHSSAPHGSVLKAKIEARKVKVTAEPAEGGSEGVLRNRIDHSRAAKSRIEQAREELERQQDPPEEKTNGTVSESPKFEPPREEWGEHASAVLEHFGWEQAGWGPPQKGDTEETDIPEQAKSTEASDQTAAEPAKDKSEQSSGHDDQEPKYLFPENSVYELDPIVVPDNMKLGATERKPTYDPKRASQKLSPIKIDKYKPGQNQTAAKADSKQPERTTKPSKMSPMVDKKVDETPVNPPQSETTEAEPQAEPSESKKEGGSWGEETGWEDAVSKQDKWEEERSGWDEVSAESDWERSGWAEAEGTDSDKQEKTDPGLEVPESKADPVDDTAGGAKPESVAEPQVKTVTNLFGNDDDEDDFPEKTEESPSAPLEDDSAKTLELEPAERKALEEKFATAGGDEPQSSFEPDGEKSILEAEAPPVQRPDFEEPAIEPFDVNRIGIETADIDQIILEQSSIQLTARNHEDEADYEERVMRELLLKEQQQESGHDQSTPMSPTDTPATGSAEPGAEETGSYDQEDVVQEFRPTDSIYELAPFVLPASGERLTDEDEQGGSGTVVPPLRMPPTMQGLMRSAEAPERAPTPGLSTDPLVGTILAHSYEILDIIGQGGMAIVYRAKQIATGRLVAIKTLRAPNPPDLMRFNQEIKTHSQLQHKNVVGFIDSINERGQLFLVMERVRGISLQEIIRTLGKLDDPENIVDILSQILDALEYAHAGGLIHRDLKTGNIILIKEVDDDMVVKILDFGIAKVQGDLQRLTHVGQALGSPIYMSPEQCSGKLLSTRSDLYSLGVVAYETVTGTPPYSKGTLINVMAAHCNENIRPKPLAEMCPELPKYKMLDQILQKALQTHPDKRWQSAAEFRTALQFWARCVRENVHAEELAVELLRCPVTELDLDTLMRSVGAAVKPKEAPTFVWAQEPVAAKEPDEPKPAPPMSWEAQQEEERQALIQAQLQEAQQMQAQSGETWVAEAQEVVPGWGEGTQQQAVVPGWGESHQEAIQAADEAREQAAQEKWGASEKHRQGQTSEAWNANESRGPQQFFAAEMISAEAPKKPQKMPSQSETSDLWNAQQQQVEDRRQRPPVRDLLSSPTMKEVEPQSFEVQTSVDMMSLGSQLPKLSETDKQEIKSMTHTGSLQVAFNDPATRTADNLNAVPSPADDTLIQPVDLRKRQAPASPPSQSQQLLSTLLIVIVSLILGFCLAAYWFVSNPDDVKAKLQSIFGESDSQKRTYPSNDDGSSTIPPVLRQQNPDIKPFKEDSSENATPQENTSSETAPSSDAAKPTEETQSSESSKAEDARPEETKKADEPTPFKKGEPEEGLDF